MLRIEYKSLRGEIWHPLAIRCDTFKEAEIKAKHLLLRNGHHYEYRIMDISFVNGRYERRFLRLIAIERKGTNESSTNPN